MFIWTEFVTIDARAALDFYRHLMGWSVEQVPMENGGTYYRLEAAGRGVGGVFQMSQAQRDAGMATGWVGYVYSSDVDGDARRLQQAGGKLYRPPEDIPVGRLAPVADPQGAGFLLFNPSPSKPAPGKGPELADGVGALAWSELHTTDSKAAFAFYSELFGWKRGEAIPMGEKLGSYQLFEVDGVARGGMMNLAQPETPHWLFYFRVDALRSAMSRCREKGGQLLQEPTQVPGGDWTIKCRDPLGGIFALTSRQR